jgi:hypothetical protein
MISMCGIRGSRVHCYRTRHVRVETTVFPARPDPQTVATAIVAPRPFPESRLVRLWDGQAGLIE